MSGEGLRILLDCRRRGDALRAKGFTPDQIADVFALWHDVSPLKVHRLAHGYTAAEAARLFNELDPAGTASLREARLYEYENFPHGGKRPSARALAIFARVYSTTARRLITDEVYGTYSPRERDLIDRADHRRTAPPRPSSAPPSRVSMNEDATSAGGTAPAALTPEDCAVLLRVLDAEEADVKRRQLLFELALGLGGAPALTLLRHLSPAEQERLARAVRTSGRIDAETVAAVAKLTARCRRLDDEFGSARVLPVVERQRELVSHLLRRQSLLPGLRRRLVAAYAELSQFAGYLHHDSLDHATARRRYHEALGAAHEIGDATLITYVHNCLSTSASYRGRLGEALDHAYAAEGWARRSPSPLLRSLHAMDYARILAKTGHTADSERAVARSFQLVERPRTEADPAYLYWWTPAHASSTATDCMLAWGRPDEVIASAEAVLAGRIPRRLSHALTLMRYAKALVAKREIPAAADKIREAAHLAVGYGSARLPGDIRETRARLEPWSGNRSVRDLDEELRSLGLTSAAPA